MSLAIGPWMTSPSTFQTGRKRKIQREISGKGKRFVESIEESKLKVGKIIEKL